MSVAGGGERDDGGGERWDDGGGERYLGGGLPAREEDAWRNGSSCMHIGRNGRGCRQSVLSLLEDATTCASRSCACLPYSTTTVRSRAHPEPHPHLSPTRVSRAIISLPCIVTGHCDTGLPRPTSGAKMALTCKTRGCAVGVHLAGEVCRGNGSDKEGDARETRVTHGLEHGS